MRQSLMVRCSLKNDVLPATINIHPKEKAPVSFGQGLSLCLCNQIYHIYRMGQYIAKSKAETILGCLPRTDSLGLSLLASESGESKSYSPSRSYVSSLPLLTIVTQVLTKDCPIPIRPKTLSVARYSPHRLRRQRVEPPDGVYIQPRRNQWRLQGKCTRGVPWQRQRNG